MFVPAGCPHRVENLTDTLALSCNYVDATNVDASLKALQDQARKTREDFERERHMKGTTSVIDKTLALGLSHFGFALLFLSFQASPPLTNFNSFCTMCSFISLDADGIVRRKFTHLLRQLGVVKYDLCKALIHTSGGCRGHLKRQRRARSTK